MQEKVLKLLWVTWTSAHKAAETPLSSPTQYSPKSCKVQTHRE